MNINNLLTSSGRDDSQDLSRTGWTLHAIGFLVTGALVIAMTVMVVRPLRGENRSVKAQLQFATSNLGQQSQIESRHAEVSTTLSEQQTLHASLLAQIPATPRESEFLAQLTELSRASGVVISGYNPGDTTQKSSHSSLAIVLKAQASHESLCRFLVGLETLPRLSHVTRLSVTTQKFADADYPVEMTIEIFFSPVHDPQHSEEHRA